MQQRVEGVYSNAEEALRTVERLRDQGYHRDEISLVANEEVRNSFAKSVDPNMTAQDNETPRSDADSNDGSFWDSIKDAFTMDESFDETNYDDPNYDRTNDPIYEHRNAIKEGSIAVLVRDDTNTEGSMSRMNADPDDVTSDNN